MPDPSGINPLVGRVAPPQAMPDFSQALDTQGRYEAYQAFRQQRVKAAQDEIAQKEAQAHLNQALTDSLEQDPETGQYVHNRGKLTAMLGPLPKNVADMLNDADKSVAAARTSQTDAIKKMAGVVDATGNSAVAFTHGLDLLVKNHIVAPQAAQQYLEAVQQDPSAVSKITAQLLGKPTAPIHVGDALVDPNTMKPVYQAPPAQPTPLQTQQAAETERHNKATEATAAGDLAIKQQAANPFGTGPAQAAAAPSGPPLAPGERNAAALTTLPKGVSDTVRLVGDYKMALPTGMALKTPYWQGILAKAAEYNPTFDASQYATRAAVRRDFTSGKTADSIQALNTAVGHLDTLQKDALALDNFDFTPFNSMRNAALKMGGDSRPGQLVEAANALAMELTKAYRGAGGSEADIEKWRQSFDAAGSPSQLNDNINQAVKLLGGLLDSIGSKYERGMGEPLNFGILNPKAQAVLDRIAPGVVHDVPGAKTGSDATGTGIKVVGKDGVTYTFPSQDKADAFKKAGG